MTTTRYGSHQADGALCGRLLADSEGVSRRSREWVGAGSELMDDGGVSATDAAHPKGWMRPTTPDFAGHRHFAESRSLEPPKRQAGHVRHQEPELEEFTHLDVGRTVKTCGKYPIVEWSWFPGRTIFPLFERSVPARKIGRNGS